MSDLCDRPTCRGHRVFVGGRMDGQVDHMVFAAPSDYYRTLGTLLSDGQRSWYVRDGEPGGDVTYRFAGIGREAPDVVRRANEAARGDASAKAKRESEASASASMPASAAQPNNLTTEQPARTRATAERLAPDGRTLGYCGNCDHWEPLGDDALCDHCCRPGAVSRTVTEAEADLAPEGPHIIDDDQWDNEWGVA